MSSYETDESRLSLARFGAQNHVILQIGGEDPSPQFSSKPSPPNPLLPNLYTFLATNLSNLRGKWASFSRSADPSILSKSPTQVDNHSPNHHSTHSHNSTHVKVLGCNLSNYPGWAQFMILSSLVFLCGLAGAYCAELVFHKAQDFDISWFLALFELGIGAACASTQKAIAKTERKGSLRDYAFLGLFFLAARVATNLSVEYMDYPTHVVIKSAKVVPMMVMGYFILKKRYSILEYLSAFLLIFGISVFMLANKSASPKFDGLSLLIGAFALLIDSLVGNNQERMMKDQDAGSAEVVHFMNSFGFAYCLIFTVLSGKLWNSIVYCSNVPSIYFPLIFCGTFSFFALSFITTLVQRFGTVVTVMMTSCRKVVTVILSYIFFPKVLVFGHFLGGAIMTVAILVEVYVKTKGGPHH